MADGEQRDGILSNADVADRLASLAQLMDAGKANPYKVKAYRRAAARLRTFSESIDCDAVVPRGRSPVLG